MCAFALNVNWACTLQTTESRLNVLRNERTNFFRHHHHHPFVSCSFQSSHFNIDIGCDGVCAHNFVVKLVTLLLFTDSSKYWQITDATVLYCTAPWCIWHTCRCCTHLIKANLHTSLWHAIDFDACLTCGMAMITFRLNWH